MLDSLGVKTIDELMKQTVPEKIALKPENRFRHEGKVLSGIHSETLMLNHLREYAFSNQVFKSYQGTSLFWLTAPRVRILPNQPPFGDPQERAREPQLVYSLHSLSG